MTRTARSHHGYPELPSYAPLDPYEAAALSQLAAGGDTNARRELVERNLRLCAKLAEGYARAVGDMSLVPELTQVGIAGERGALSGLMRAAETFDPTKGSFSTHATGWIRQAMRDWLASQHLVETRRTHSRNTLARRAAADLGTSDPDAVLDALSTSSRERFSRRSVEAALTSPRTNAGPDALCECPGEPCDLDDAIEHTQQLEAVRHEMAVDLPDLSRRVIELKHSPREPTLADIAAELGLPAEQVRRAYAEGIAQLKDAFA